MYQFSELSLKAQSRTYSATGLAVLAGRQADLLAREVPWQPTAPDSGAVS